MAKRTQRPVDVLRKRLVDRPVPINSCDVHGCARNRNDYGDGLAKCKLHRDLYLYRQIVTIERVTGQPIRWRDATPTKLEAAA